MTHLRPHHIDAGTVRDWLDEADAVTVIDVRGPAEFETCTSAVPTTCR